jgi:DNA-binding MarR family transcriptional regulator
MAYEQLKLKNQICFPVYAASRLITREYQPYLEKLGITYPQYLVLMVLWENDGISINEISKKLILNTNTTTPLLKRMEKQGLLKRHRSESDERIVIVTLTPEGKRLREEAASIPEKLISELKEGPLKVEEFVELRERLHAIIEFLAEKKS